MLEIRLFENCLLAGAIGDALGYFVEFDDVNHIFEKYGRKGIVDYPSTPARFSDDTQMTLFTAEGLLKGTYVFNKGVSEKYVIESYLRWLETQDGHYEPNMHPKASLMAHEELWRRMDPGTTCLSALRAYHTSPKRPYADNESRGCGGVMRSAPVGLFYPFDAYDMGCRLARITHGDDDAVEPSGFLAEMIAQMVHLGASMEQAAKSARLKLKPDGDTNFLVSKALHYAEQEGPIDAHDKVSRLGSGWEGDEALAIALYSALVSESRKDFSFGLSIAVNHGGDSDSTGAIYGNIVGAAGWDIPSKWIDGLELAHVIQDIAGKLFDAAEWRSDNEGVDYSKNRPF